MTDFAESGSPTHQLRVALSRLLHDFQDDLRDLESRGLEARECEEVKAVLAQAIAVFEKNAKGPGSPNFEIAKHFRDYARIYAQWNGHEGDEPGKSQLRRREVSLLADQRKKLFSKLASRQAELHRSGQLDLPFVGSVRTPLANLAKKHSVKFPRLRQATELFG